MAPHLATLPGFLLAFAANLLLDGSVALSFIMTGTATTLLTPRDIRGRVGAVCQIYSSFVRAIGMLVLGAIATKLGVTAAFGLLVVAFVATAMAMAHGPMPDGSA